MNKKLVLSVFMVVLFILSFSMVNAEEIIKIDDTYIIKSGSTIVTSNQNAILKSSNDTIAKVSDGKVLVDGSGRFTLSVTLDGKVQKYNFFAWNAYLKNNGRYFTYKDSDGYHSSGRVLYSNTFLAVSKENRCFKINDYIFYTNGKYSGNILKGLYLGYFFNASSNKSTSRYFEYSMIKNNTVYELKLDGKGIETESAKTTEEQETEVVEEKPILKLKEAKLNIEVNKTAKIEIAEVRPSSVTITYKSSNSKVATVNSEGIVKGIKKGTAVITVSIMDAIKNNGKNSSGVLATAKCTINVSESKSPEVVKVKKISLSKSKVTLNVGESSTLVATVSPDNATNKTLTWSSSNSKIAQVNDGKVTAVKKGTAIITVKSTDGSNKTAKCTITVKEKKVEQEKPVLKLKSSSLSVDVNKTVKIEIKELKPTNATVTYKSANNKVATVDNNGNVKGIKKGTTTITVREVVSNRVVVIAKCKIKVTNLEEVKIVKIKRVSLNKAKITLNVGESSTLIATVSPDNATNKALTWSSSNSKIAQVSDGKVTAVKKGTAIITVKSTDGSNKTAKCTITVKEKKVEQEKPVLKLKVSSLSVDVNKTVKIEIAELKPSNATLTYKSANNKVATVDVNGNVKGIKKGTTTITIREVVSNKVVALATCKINVTNLEEVKVIKVQKIVLDKTKVTLNVGESSNLSATISPSNASNKNLKWESSNNNVVKVDNGKVTAIKSGTAIIYAKSLDGANIKASCTVTVKDNEKTEENRLKVLFIGNSKTFVNKYREYVISLAVKSKGYKFVGGPIKAKNKSDGLYYNVNIDSNGKISLSGASSNSTGYESNFWEKNKVNNTYYCFAIGGSTFLTKNNSLESGAHKNRKTEFENLNPDIVIMQEGVGNDKLGGIGKREEYYEGAKKIIERLMKNNPNVKIFIRDCWGSTNTSTYPTLKPETENTKYVVDRLNSELKLKNKIKIIYDGDVIYKAYSDENIKNILSDSVHQSPLGAYAVALETCKTVFDFNNTQIQNAYTPEELKGYSLDTINKIKKLVIENK